MALDAGITCATTVNAPVQRVFEVYSDLQNAGKNVSAIKSLVLLTPGPVGKGTRFRETRTMFGKDATEEMEITEFNPPRGYTVECRNHGCHYVSTFVFEPAGPSSTSVTMNFKATPLTTPARIMSALTGWMLKGTIHKCMAKDFEDLKHAAESA